MYWEEFVVKWNAAQGTLEEYQFAENVQRLIQWIQRFGLVSHKSGEFFFGKKKRNIAKIYNHLSDLGIIMSGQLASAKGRMAIYTRADNPISDNNIIRKKLIIEFLLHTWSQLFNKLEWYNDLVRVDNARTWEIIPVTSEPIPEPKTAHPLWIGKDWDLLKKSAELYGGVVTTPDMAEKGIVMEWGGNWLPNSLIEHPKNEQH